MSRIIPRDLIRHLEWTPGTELPPPLTPAPAVSAPNAAQMNVRSVLDTAETFYDTSLPTALRNAQAKRNHILTMPQLLEARLAVGDDHNFWSTWYTAFSEENVGKTPAGNTVLVAVHGGGILTADRVQAAYDEGLTPQKAAKYTDKEMKNLLSGKLADGSDIPMFLFDDFKRRLELPDHYGVILDFEIAKNTSSGHQPIDRLRDNPLVAIRCGGVAQANKYLDRAKTMYSTSNYGCWHPFGSIDPAVSQGRLLFLGGSDDYGLLGDYGDLDGYGRFVGVGAPEARPPRKK